MGKILFICNTPLQLLLSRSICNQKNIKKTQVTIAYFSDYFCPKTDFYLSEVSGFSVRLIKINSKLKTLKFKKQLDLIDWGFYEEAYIASIDSVYSQLILSHTIFQKLYTFDDGSANVIKSSSFYNETKSFRSLFRDLVVNNKYDVQKILNNSNEHYSIYKSKDNIIDKVSYINIPKRNFNREKFLSGDELNVFMGSVYDNIVNNNADKIKLIEAVEIFLKKKDACYFRHPRDQNIIYNDESNLIIEDFIYDQSKYYNVINIFSFCSTALHFINSIDNVNVYIINSEYLASSYRNVFEEYLSDGFFAVDLEG